MVDDNNKQIPEAPKYLEKLNTPQSKKTTFIVFILLFVIIAAVAIFNMGIKSGMTITIVLVVGGVFSYWQAQSTVKASEKHSFGSKKRK